MGSSGGGQLQPIQSQTATKDPWSGAQPFISQALTGAAGLYNAGAAGSYMPYTGATLGAVDARQVQGQNDMQALAQSEPYGSANLTAARDYAGNMIKSGGLNEGMQGAAGQFQDIYNRAQGDQNPYLQSILDTSNRQISDKIGSAMSGAGRYGSGQHTDVAARAMAEAADPVLAQDYARRQARQMQATGSLADLYNTGIQNAGNSSQLMPRPGRGALRQFGKDDGPWAVLYQSQSGAVKFRYWPIQRLASLSVGKSRPLQRHRARRWRPRRQSGDRPEPDRSISRPPCSGCSAAGWRAPASAAASAGRPVLRLGAARRRSARDVVGEGRKMPASLMDMFSGNAPLEFSPRDYAGNQIGMGDAIAQNSNSLVGLGMGLLQPSRPGESPYAAALQGFQAGSVADASAAISRRNCSTRRRRRRGRRAVWRAAARQARRCLRREQDSLNRDLRSGNLPAAIQPKLRPNLARYREI